MTQDLITLDISDADWTAIDAALTTLEDKLGSKLLDLTIDQRKQLTKMGDKSEAFGRQTLITARLNIVKLPADAAADLTIWSIPLKVWTGNKEDDRLSSRRSARREWALPKLVGAGRGRFRCAGSRVELRSAFPSR